MIIGSLAAGCSSGVQRFTNDGSIFTGSTPNQRSIIRAPGFQAYPGDKGVEPATARDYAASGVRAAVQPVDLTATRDIERSALPPVDQVKARAKSLAAPAVAAVANAREKIAARLKPASDTVSSATGKAASAVKSATQPASLARAELDEVTTGSLATSSANRAKSAAAEKVEKTVAAVEQPVKRGWSKAGGTAITLREGETLANLSRRFGVPVSAIVAANDLKSATDIQAGQKVVIPTYVYSSDAPVSAPDSNPDVAASKSSRGKKEPVPAKKPGDAPEKSTVAVLPQTPRPKDKEAAPVAAAKAADKPADKAKTVAAKPVKVESVKPAATVAGGYKVQSGDSLWTIAKKTGSTTAAIKAANRLDGAPLKIGQVLVIPAKTASAEKSANVDPIVTGSSKPNKPATAAAARKTESAAVPKSEQLPTYTAPKAADAAIADAEKDTAAAPEQTGIGKMRWPAKGKVVSGYGKSSDGIDIALPAGTPVKAAENGVVIYAGDGLKEYGNTVLVRHEDGLVTVYGHNANLKVKRGDKVSRGQEIASSGMSGQADSPKLHFEVRKNSTPVDPSKYLD